MLFRNQFMNINNKLEYVQLEGEQEADSISITDILDDIKIVHPIDFNDLVNIFLLTINKYLKLVIQTQYNTKIYDLYTFECENTFDFSNYFRKSRRFNGALNIDQNHFVFHNDKEKLEIFDSSTKKRTCIINNDNFLNESSQIS